GQLPTRTEAACAIVARSVNLQNLLAAWQPRDRRVEIVLRIGLYSGWRPAGERGCRGEGRAVSRRGLPCAERECCGEGGRRADRPPTGLGARGHWLAVVRAA